MQPEILSLPFQSDAEGCSKAGAAHALPGATSQAGNVLDVIRQHGPVTDRELVALTGYPINIINARRNALVSRGFVQSAGTVEGRYGVKNTAWVVVGEGR